MHNPARRLLALAALSLAAATASAQSLGSTDRVAEELARL